MFFCIALLILYGFMECQSANPKRLEVVGPDVPLVAVAGVDLVLPCFIKPNTSAVDMTVEWLRLETGVLLVHRYNDRENRNEMQDESYRGRTALFKEELQKGNASLKLSSLKVSDEGEYQCNIEDKDWADDVTVLVIVEALGSHPVITVESHDYSGGVNLVCESRGWNPEPEVLWLDKDGATLPAEDPHIHKHSDGFSVKRRITVYYYSDSKRFYCRLQHKHHMMETDIIINSNIFYTWKWAVSCSVLTCLSAVGLILTAVMCHKKGLQFKKQNAERDKQREKDGFTAKKFFKVDVTLDPDTAHPQLILSDDEKQVKHVDTPQDLPESPQRFHFPGVVGKQSFYSERFYYEVQVRGKTAWALGVVNGNIDRQKQTAVKQINGFWLVELINDKVCKAYTDPPVTFKLREKLETVGVFVDYDEHLVSFYDVKSSSPIHSFTGQYFTEKLYPYFSPCNNNRGTNSAPLVITHVNN